MRTKGAKDVGRFAVDFEVANSDDMALARRGLLPAEQIRRKAIRAWVDSGAAALVLPKVVADELGLPLGDPINVRYADGRRARRREAEGAYVELLGRHNTFHAVVEPKRDSALIGAIVLEALDLLVDCKHQRVIPRDPSGPIYEIEWRRHRRDRPVHRTLRLYAILKHAWYREAIKCTHSTSERGG